MHGEDGVHIEASAADDGSVASTMEGMIERIIQVEAQLRALQGTAGETTATVVAGAQEQIAAEQRVAQVVAEVMDVKVATAAEYAAMHEHLAEIRANSEAEAAAKIAGIDGDLSDKQLAIRLATFRQDVEMGRLTLEQRVEKLDALLVATKFNAAQRIAIEREVTVATKELIAQDILALRDRVLAEKLGAEQHAAILANIIATDESAKSARALYERELVAVQKEVEAARTAAAKAAAAERVRIAREEELAKRSGIMSNHEATTLGYGIGNIAGMGTGYNVQTLLTSSSSMLAQIAVLGAAFLTIQKGTEFLKESIKAASDLEDQMRRLTTAVHANGEAWGEARGKVESFISSEARYTGFAKHDLLEAYTLLVNAGHSRADAEALLLTIEDTAIAKGLEVIEVTRKVTESEAGRGTGLAHLDPRLKDLIHNHDHLSQVVNKLADDMRGQATNATDDYSRATGRLKAAWDDFKEDVGTWLLPWLKDLVEEFHNTIDQIHLFVAALGTLEGNTHKRRVALGQEVFGNEAEKKKGAAAMRALDKSDEEAYWHIANPLMAAHELENQAKYLAEQRRKHRKRTLDHDPRMGFEKTGSSGAGYSPNEVAADFSTDPTALDKRGAALDKALAQQKLAYAGIAEAIKLATSAQGAYSAQVMLANVTVAQATVAVDDLTKQRNAEGREIARLTAELPKAKQAIIDAAAAQNKAAAAAKGVKKGHEDLKTAVHDSSATFSDAVTTYNTVESKLKTLTSTYATHGQQIAAETLRLNAYKEMVAAVNRELDAMTQAQQRQAADAWGAHGLGYQAQLKYWQSVSDAAGKKLGIDDKGQFTNPDPIAVADYKRARDAINALQLQHDVVDPRAKKQSILTGADEDATYGKSLQAAIAFYRRKLELVRSHGEEYAGETRAIEEKIRTLESEEYRKRIDAVNKFVQDVREKEVGFLNELISKHKSFRDTLHDVFDSIRQSFVHMIEEMIVKAALLGPTLKLLAALGVPIGPEKGKNATLLGGPSALSGAIAAGGASTSSYGILGALLGGSGAQQVVSGIPTNGGLLSTFTGNQGASVLSKADTTRNEGAAGKPGGGGTNALGVTLGNALAGVALGASIAPGNPWAMIGGAAGGAIGGPFGAAAGAIIGSFFGPHWGPGSNYPDRSDPSYAQWLTNYQGAAATVNGQYVSPDLQHNVAFGGTGTDTSIQNWLKSHASDWQSLPPGVQALYKQLLALGPDIGIANEHNGVFTLNDGTKIPVAQLQSLVATWQQVAGNNPAAGLYTITRSYPDFNKGVLTNNSGAPVGSPGATTGLTPTAPPAGTTPSIILDHPTFYGTAPDEFVVDLARRLKQVAGNEVAGVGRGPTTYLGRPG